MDGDDHADDDHADIRYLITEGTLLYGNQFLFFLGGGRVGKNWHTPPSSITLALHNVFEDRNAEGEHDMTITPLHRIEIW